MANTVPLNKVESRTVDFLSLYGGREEPYVAYEFGGGRKRFMSDKQGEGIYGKPVSISGGVTTHLPDLDLIPFTSISISISLSGNSTNLMT